MKISPEFQKFCSLLHQDILLLHTSLDPIIAYALGGLDVDERSKLAFFLRSLISADTTDESLVIAWDQGGSDILVGGAGEIRRFFSQVLKHL